MLLVVCMRPKQWLKNGFVVLPALFGEELASPGQAGRVAAAVACFCIGSSALYLVNDVLDREQDRRHPKKRWRPIAARQITPRTALTASAVMLVVALGGAVLVDPLFAVVLGGYCAMTAAYSLWLKHEVILDVMTIAAGFVLRVIAGAVVVDVEPSAWILICTGLLALMLAFAKRRHEGLSLADAREHHRRVLAHYSPAFVDAMIILTAGATLTAYAAYTTVGKAADAHLAGSIPFVLYGVLRYLWIVFHRNEGGSPTAVVWSDRPLQATIALWVVTVGVLLAVAGG